MSLNTWYTVKAKYTKQLDNGALKRVTEPYLVAAMTFTDAEARIYEELGQLIRGEFKVVNITPIELSDIFAWGDCGEWFRAKVQYESVDADTEKTQKVTQLFLIEARSVKESYERLNESLKGLLVDYRIVEVKESRIIDIFPYKEPK